ncbi:MAG: two-component system, sensor histidine kinase and response regulator, partial [Solirubrobacteraceae bacterium]|nr:two-component system, sensor histidine kinase and response regulator [Solirubrobacteraceae bacterium]
DCEDELKYILTQIGRGEPVEMETVRIDRSGERIEVSLRIKPLYDDGGVLVGASSTCADITQRNLLEAQLRANSRHFEISTDITTTANFEGYFVTANPAVEAILGWSAAEFTEVPFIERVHPDDRAATLAEVEKLGEGKRTMSFVNRYATKGGGYRWIDWNAVVPPDDELIYCSGRDITDRKRAEAALSISERRTREILETAHDAFVAIDAEGAITDWNRKAEMMFGWSRAEALGRDLAETIIPVGDHAAHRRGLKRFAATGAGGRLGTLVEMPALHRDGHGFVVEMTISPAETDGGYTFNAFLRDITDRRRAGQELARARDDALQASKMKSMFVANVSHEIRTPMNGVLGMSELLLDTGLDDDQRNYAEMIAASGEALLEVIDDILDFSKIEAGKLELDPTDFDLPDAIEKACGMQASRAHKKAVELLVAIDADVPPWLHGDAARLRQVLSNLVSNAIKFTPAGEVVVRVSSTANDGAELVRVEVSDTGIGIEPAVLESLFRPFSQADITTTRKYGGTGLGLAIAKQLLELMGGTIGATSEAGKGSTFWFELSLAHPRTPTGPPPDRRALAGVSVLVVDDNATSRELLEHQLSSWHMTCDVAESAAVALRLMESAASAGRPYALALIDRTMPGGNGHSLARSVRDQPALRDMQLVLLSSSAGRPEDFADPALFDRTLGKPVRQSRLYGELKALIAGQSPPIYRSQVAAVDVDPTDHAARPEILVVEDTPVNQVVAVRMLQKCGFRARVAGNGHEALQALAERSYAAVLMDCQMPELDGYETTGAIRNYERDGRRVPIIAMTANSMRGERERCLAVGMDDYLVKPLRSQTLKDTLRSWISAPQHPPATVPATTVPEDEAAERVLLDEALIADLGFDETDLTELFSMYLAQAGGQVAELDAAIGRGESGAVARTMHDLKGSSATIGATFVCRLAAELEATAKAGELDGAPEIVERLRTGLADTTLAVAARG